MARRKITEVPAIAIMAKELPDLTAQQMAFVQAIVAGKTATEAYRLAYDASGMLATTIWCAASKLRSDDKVSQWISAARIAGLGSVTVTLERHLSELERIKSIAIASGNVGAALGCEQTIGKAAGLHIERVQEVPADPVQTLRDIAEHQPDLAASLAAAHGIPWTSADEHATKH